MCFREVIHSVPPTEEAPEEYEDIYEEEDAQAYTESYLNDSTFTEEHKEEHKEHSTESPKIKHGEFTLQHISVSVNRHARAVCFDM